MKIREVPLRVLISFLYAFIILLTFSAISFFVFHYWRVSVEDFIAQREADIESNIIAQVDAAVTVPLYINESTHGLLQNGIVDMKNKKEREQFFAGIVQANGADVYSFTYGTRDGEYYGARRNAQNRIEIVENNSATGGKSRYFATDAALRSDALVEETGPFDPRTRDWYRAAEEARGPTFSAVYKHFVMDDLAISAAYPIYGADGQLEGVLGTHLILSKLNDALKSIVGDRDITAYIIERKTGDIVANSLGQPNFRALADGQYGRVNLNAADDEHIAQAYAQYKESPQRSFRLAADRDMLNVAFTEYNREGLQWLVVTSISENQFFTADIYKSILLAALISVLFIIVSTVVYILSTNAIIKPVYGLIETSDRFAAGDLAQRVEVKRNDEFGRLAYSFNKMADELQALIVSLEEKVSDRTAELEKMNAALKDSEGNIRLLLNSAAEAIYGVDREGRCTFCNASFLKMLRFQRQEDVIGCTMHGLIHSRYPDGSAYPQERCEIHNAYKTGESVHVENETLWRTDGTSFPVEIFSHPTYRNGQVVGAVVTFLDISQRVESERHIYYLAHHDQLTGLYNRRFFEEELERLEAQGTLPITIVMADMNGLKLINDSFGHIMGDRALRKVAEVLQKGCRPEDIVARLGGDEFVLLLQKDSAGETEQLIARLREWITREEIGPVKLSISFGYARKSQRDEHIEDVFQRAEDSMYKNKMAESPAIRGQLIHALIRALHEKSEKEREHSCRVAELCEDMGRALGLDEAEIDALRTGGFLHDIGKIALPDDILTRPDKLTDEEYETLKRHSEIGYRILKTAPEMAAVAEHVLFHHERWDGRGYPRGMAGQDIPLQSRIIALADAYDAMTGKRNHRSALPAEQAAEELRRGSGTQFDPELTRLFLAKVAGR